MSERKPGWKRVKLGDLVQRYVEKVTNIEDSCHFVGVDHLDSEDLFLRRWGVVGIDEIPPTFRFAFKKGMVLVPTRRPRLKKCAIAPFDGLTGEKVLVLHAIKNSGLNPNLVPFLVSSPIVQNWNIDKEVGSVTPHFRWSDMAECEINLPPEQDQVRFIELAQSTEAMITKLRQAKTHSEHMTRRLLESFDLGSMKQISVKNLLLEPPKNGVSPSCNGNEIGYPTLSVGCVYSGFVDTSADLKYANLDEATYQRFRLSVNDVLVVRGNGNRNLVGRAGIVVDSNPICFFPDLLIRLRFDPSMIDPRVGTLLWNCIPVHSALIRRSKSTNGIYKINGSDIREHVLPLPTKAQQAAMLEAAEIHEATLRALCLRIREVAALKSSLIVKMTSETP